MNFTTFYSYLNLKNYNRKYELSVRASQEKKMNAAIDSHVCNIKIRCFFFEVRVSQFMNIKNRKNIYTRKLLLINNVNSPAHNQTSLNCLFLNDKATITKCPNFQFLYLVNSRKYLRRNIVNIFLRMKKYQQ